QTRGNDTSYYLADGQHSIRALVDETGTLTDTYDYTAFGELYAQTGNTVNQYLYTGQQYDPLTGNYSLRARYYDPADGRFLSRDKYPCLTCNIQEYNRYVYTANNPINFSDPSGHLMIETQNLSNIGISSSPPFRILGIAIFLLLLTVVTALANLNVNTNCAPCNPPPPNEWHTKHSHHPCKLPVEHWHHFSVHQKPWPDCTCRTQREFGGCIPPTMPPSPYIKI
ncbi:MAG: RHS repeat-associated core domain-containing protein, partial [Bacteroidetes bacterium]